MITATYSTDHETALAAGFDIVSPGRWVRPDSAAIWRSFPESPHHQYYLARRSSYVWAPFYTMREAVEWIGPVTEPDYLDIEWHETRP